VPVALLFGGLGAALAGVLLMVQIHRRVDG
jgi:hypothetical protein